MKFTKTLCIALISMVSTSSAETPALWKNQKAIQDVAVEIEKLVPVIKEQNDKIAKIKKQIADLNFDESKADDMKKKCDEAAKKKAPKKAALLLADDECATFEKNQKEFETLNNDMKPIKLQATQLEGKLKTQNDDLEKKDPLFNPPTTETITKRIIASQTIFLVPYVKKSNKLSTFELLSGYLAKELEHWQTLKTKESGDRLKADDMSIKFMTDFKDFLDTKIIVGYKKAVEESKGFNFPSADFEKAEKQYYHDFIKASIGQALTLKASDPDNTDKYDKFLTTYQEEAKNSKVNLEDVVFSQDKGGLPLLVYVAIGVLFILLVVCVLIKRNKTKDGKTL